MHRASYGASHTNQHSVDAPTLPPKSPAAPETYSPASRPPPPLPIAPPYAVSELSADQSISPPLSTGQSHVPFVEVSWLPAALEDRSTIDLQQVLSDHTLQSALLNNPQTSHGAIRQSSDDLRPLIEANVSLAASLESLGEQLTSQRASTQSRLLALRALEQQHRSKIAETEDALRDFSPMALYQRLSASVTEQEQLLRGIEESWIDEPGEASERELGDWIKRVKDSSRVAFLRKERKARWDEGRVGGWK